MASGSLLHLPAGRRGQGDAQALVEEVAPARHALGPALAERDAVDGAQVARPAVVGIAALVAGRDPADVGQALVVAGVRGQPVRARRRRAALGPGLVGGEALLVLEHADDVDHVLRVVAVARQVFGAQLVGLQFLFAAVRGDVARGHALRHLAGQVGGAGHARRAFQHRAQHRGRQHAEPGVLLARGALRAVARGDMADLVADDAGQFGFAVHVGHDAARDVDKAAGQGEGVDLRAVEHREGPGQVGAVRLAGELLPEVVDVGLQRRVVDGTVFGQHLCVGLAAFGDLAGLVHHRALGAAGHGVDDLAAAACDQQGGKQDGRERGRPAGTVHGRGSGGRKPEA